MGSSGFAIDALRSLGHSSHALGQMRPGEAVPKRRNADASGSSPAIYAVWS